MPAPHPDQPDLELPLVEQAPWEDWWHAYGPLPDGGTHVHGPTTIPTDTAASLGGLLVPPGQPPVPYLGCFDHQPTTAELKKAMSSAVD